jgi:tight adherence protein C
VRELEVGYRRREALERVVSRTGSASLAAVASAARLAEDFGTPLAAALRTLAVELRAQRRQRLQEAALRAPVTMLLPTAGFILVPIFGIVLGPIAIRLATGTLF